MACGIMKDYSFIFYLHKSIIVKKKYFFAERSGLELFDYININTTFG